MVLVVMKIVDGQHYLKKYIIGMDDTKECNNFAHIAGFPGARSNDILNRIDNILDGYKFDDFKNIVILSVGVNDTQCFNGKYRITKEDYKSNIENIIKKVKEKDYELIIFGLTKIGVEEKIEFKPNKFYDNNVVVQYDSILKELCKNSMVKCISMYDVLQNEDFADGLHPNENGYKKIFETLIKYL